ncbi:hypothetical protein [Streptomyces boncukensis]|uniref:Secreted protein n=1 Tax=Streptomyces boncukensis TaxID=2711219 RepID=A0A6G4WXU6_9ACTN|nr:hypothetical protein [Streptomyces boncukensis]NGO69682.1 hypothetical protein [Streptomyces boncukensis]
MHKLLAAALTCVVAAALAVGTGLGIVAALNATPDQPNVPLVRFNPTPTEGPASSPSPSGSPDASGSPSPGSGGSPAPDDTGASPPESSP